MGEPDILLTNDDGINATGLGALYTALSSVGSVTAVAPAEDQSAVGRALSQSVTVRDHELGYVIDGTPSDCVVTGLSSLLPETDLVVAGCNCGANLGEAVLGRSGTISAAVEAAFFDVPAIASSLYVPPKLFDAGETAVSQQDYADAVAATAFLAASCFEAGVFEHADYLNINAPVTEDSTGEMVVTRPSHIYEMGTKADGDEIRVENRIWEKMAAGSIDDPEGTDRHAIVANQISVSPLTAPHTTSQHEALDELVAGYSDSPSE